LWITEVHQYAVSGIPGDKTFIPSYARLTHLLVRSDDVAQSLRIEAVRELSGTLEITIHDCDLPALGAAGASALVN
jgi:hypothetical protein